MGSALDHQLVADETYEEAAGIFKALAHPLRLKLVCTLFKQPATQTVLVRDLALPQSSIAQHLAVLRRAGIVDGSRNGTEITLEVCDPRVSEMFRALCANSSIRLDFDA